MENRTRLDIAHFVRCDTGIMGMFEKINIYTLAKILKYLKVKYVCRNALKLLQRGGWRGMCVWGGI